MKKVRQRLSKCYIILLLMIVTIYTAKEYPITVEGNELRNNMVHVYGKDLFVYVHCWVDLSEMGEACHQDLVNAALLARSPPKVDKSNALRLAQSIHLWLYLWLLYIWWSHPYQNLHALLFSFFIISYIYL